VNRFFEPADKLHHRLLRFGQIGWEGSLAPSSKAFMLQPYKNNIGMASNAMGNLKRMFELEVIWMER
jgi:hypothetical protein